LLAEADDLEHLADLLDSIVSQGWEEPFKSHLERLKLAAENVGAAWSGSWIGYHANVYYSELKSPVPGDHFSPEWGLMHSGEYDSETGWQEFTDESIRVAIFKSAGDPDLSAYTETAARARGVFVDKREEVLSVLESLRQRKRDSFIERLQDEARSLNAFSAKDFVASQAPSGQVWSRDSTAMTQGLWTPPHISVLAETFALQQPFKACEALARLSRRAAAHIRRLGRQAVRDERIGTNVFIGHGRSSAWRALKDFIQDRLKLPWDEFNRVPVAGVTNTSRLSEMLDSAAIALIVMTAEDEQADGKLRARENVVHEAGLFQGRLGFTRAILLLEDGCEEFSNIHGLGQIRFGPDRIDRAFEEVRRVLEREGLLTDPVGEA
jgi:predicted nucleotide-binding protein